MISKPVATQNRHYIPVLSPRCLRKWNAEENRVSIVISETLHSSLIESRRSIRDGCS